MVHRVVQRRGSSHRWRGVQHRFRWDDGWVHAGRTDLAVRGDRRAEQISGWHVPGLSRRQS